MDKFLETYNLSRLNHEKIENLNRVISRTEHESIIKNLPKNKCPGPDNFIDEFYKTLKYDLISTLFRIFQTIE